MSIIAPGMSPFESSLAVLGAISSLTGLHSWFTGIHTGRRMDQILEAVKKGGGRHEQLSENVTYTDIEEVRVLEGRSEKFSRLSDMESLLSPIQKMLNADLLSTALISTPELLRQQFRRDPWEVLVEIRPFSRAQRPTNPALLPILFQEEGEYYVGWQTKGVIETVLGAEYTPYEIVQPFSKAPPDPWVSGKDTELSIGGVSFRMIWIAPGTFWMGSPDEDKEAYKDEKPRHKVTLTEGFWMAEVPCTQALWQAITGESPSRFKGTQNPVERVSWNNIQTALNALNEREPALGFRLPTEAEWEYCCRADTETPRYETLDRVAWYGDNSDGTTHPVGQKVPNSWGLYDTLGNVWEWCQDGDGPYSDTPIVNPLGPRKGVCRVLRGGSWSSSPRHVRAAYRNDDPPSGNISLYGFRLSRGLSASRQGTRRV